MGKNGDGIQAEVEEATAEALKTAGPRGIDKAAIVRPFLARGEVSRPTLYRWIDATIARVTEEAEEAARPKPKPKPDEMGVGKLENCASRTQGAIAAAGITLPTSRILPDTPQDAELAAAALLNARTVTIPKGGTIPYTTISQFNPMSTAPTGQ